MLPGAAQLVYVDVDDTVRQTFGYGKQGAGRGDTGVKGLNALLAVISTPASAPVIAAAPLRKGSTNSVKGAHRLVADALVTAKAAGATGVRVLRADSAFYSHEVIAAARRHGSCFSITARQDSAVRKPIAAIDADAWTPIKYTNAVFDEDTQRWISDAEVAETGYTAFAAKGKDKQVTARLIVRRVPGLNQANQSELFTAYRCHAVFTNSPLPMHPRPADQRASPPRAIGPASDLAPASRLAMGARLGACSPAPDRPSRHDPSTCPQGPDRRQRRGQAGAPGDPVTLQRGHSNDHRDQDINNGDAVDPG